MLEFRAQRGRIIKKKKPESGSPETAVGDNFEFPDVCLKEICLYLESDWFIRDRSAYPENIIGQSAISLLTSRAL